MLVHAKPLCFVLTADMAKARDFYTHTLGLTETGADAYAISYDLAGTAMRLTQVEGHVPSGHTVIGWLVDDIEAAADDLAAEGVTFAVHDGFGQDARGIWTDPGSGTRIAWFNDPEGNNLSLTQMG